MKKFGILVFFVFIFFCQKFVIEAKFKLVNTLLCHQCAERYDTHSRCSHRDEWKVVECKRGQACMTTWASLNAIQRGCYSASDEEIGCWKYADTDYVCYCNTTHFCNV